MHSKIPCAHTSTHNKSHECKLHDLLSSLPLPTRGSTSRFLSLSVVVWESSRHSWKDSSRQQPVRDEFQNSRTAAKNREEENLMKKRKNNNQMENTTVLWYGIYHGTIWLLCFNIVMFLLARLKNTTDSLYYGQLWDATCFRTLLKYTYLL